MEEDNEIEQSGISPDGVEDKEKTQKTNHPDMTDVVDDAGTDHFFGLRDLTSFKKSFIDTNRGKPLILIRFEKIEGMDLLEFLNHMKDEIRTVLEVSNVEFGFHYIDNLNCLLMGISPMKKWNERTFPNIDSAIGRFHDNCILEKTVTFDFGVARTQCNYISNSEEMYNELFEESRKNLTDNLVRWSWTNFNRAYTYISGTENVVIQPTLYLDPKKRTFSVKGGEVFVGGGHYPTYRDLISDIPDDREMNRVELLILEKLISGCENAPGLLKFNISPQSLIDTFSTHEKVNRMYRLIHASGLNPKNVRLELVEKPYREKKCLLKDVCQDFWNYGISFAADDFGVRSQSHQVVLNLGIMIKEFKLDPISFKFKAEEDQIKFLDNLAFIEYCKRLADNRAAPITAEAVEDYETLQFLIEHQIFQFQANMFCGKMPIDEYKEKYTEMCDLSQETAYEIFNNEKLFNRQKETQNIFKLAKELNL